MLYLEHQGSRWTVFFVAENRELFDNNNIMCLQEVHGKDEFLQAFLVLAPRFFFWYLHSWKRKCRRIGHLHS